MSISSSLSLMQQALGAQWEQLPPALQAHYQAQTHHDEGALDIEYPGFMQPYLSVLRLFGALVNRRGQGLPTTVSKHMEGDVQRWNRSIRFPDGKVIYFKSRWVYAGGNELIEYVNPLLGLRMAVEVRAGELHYSGRHLVLKLGGWLIPVPEWLVLGHTTIVESAQAEDGFVMDFRLTHPWLGQVFRYAGRFGTKTGAVAPT